MGNCLPFFPFISNNGDDLTTLNNLSDERNQSSHLSRQNSRSTIDNNRSRSSRRRSLQPVIILLYVDFMKFYKLTKNK